MKLLTTYALPLYWIDILGKKKKKKYSLISSYKTSRVGAYRLHGNFGANSPFASHWKRLFSSSQQARAITTAILSRSRMGFLHALLMFPGA